MEEEMRRVMLESVINECEEDHSDRDDYNNGDEEGHIEMETGAEGESDEAGGNEDWAAMAAPTPSRTGHPTA
jgi:hypothetical protein